MADALQVPYHRHSGLRLHALNETFTAARHNDIDRVTHRRQQVTDSGAIRCRHHLNCSPRNAGGCKSLGEGTKDRLTRMKTLRAAAQNSGIARFRAQSSSIGGNIGAALVNNADDAQWHRDTLYVQAVRSVPFREYAANRVG